jgi:hypothetical protein
MVGQWVCMSIVVGTEGIEVKGKVERPRGHAVSRADYHKSCKTCGR